MHVLFQNSVRFVRSNEIEQVAGEDGWKCKKVDSVNPRSQAIGKSDTTNTHGSRRYRLPVRKGDTTCFRPISCRHARPADTNSSLESGVLVVYVYRFFSNGDEIR